MTWKQLNSRSMIVTLLQKSKEHTQKKNRELLEEAEQSKQHKAEKL